MRPGSILHRRGVFERSDVCEEPSNAAHEVRDHVARALCRGPALRRGGRLRAGGRHGALRGRPDPPGERPDLRPEAGATQWGGAGRVRGRFIRRAAGGRQPGERPLHRRTAEPRPPPRRRHDELRAARCTRGTAGASGRRLPVRPRLHGSLHRLAMGRLPEPGAAVPRRAFGHGGRQADRRGDDGRDPTERARDDAPPRRPHPPTAPGRARGAARRTSPRARLGGR